jgi:hypothetical protein
MDANNTNIFDWEKDIYIQDCTTFGETEEAKASSSLESSIDDDKENISPTNGSENCRARILQNRGSNRVPLQDITHLFKRPSREFGSLDSCENGYKVRKMVRAIR